MGPYQNIPAIVINDHDDDHDSNETLSKKHKKKNILYSGILFLAIVGVSLMLSMKGGGTGNKDGGHGGSSLTNLRTITDTVTVTDTCPPCDYPTSHYGYHRHLCRQVCHNTKEEQTQASDPLSHYSPTACTGTFIKCGDKHPDCKACVFDTTTDSF
mmetsp:Transcript_29026/g.33380  ORF Transcript_29026/g.33380 Transcript_29026/m.33380 type:complete len:156 (-) Transcript_29026:313-780(-)